MKVSYRAPAGMLSWASKRALIAVGLLVLPITLCFDKATETTPPKVKPNLPVLHQPDPRAVRLQKFLSRLQCPVSNLADEFIRAADENGLDWRLLPSIAVMESGGGK